MSVDSKTVRRIARLARIALDDREAAAMETELNALLSWVEQLSEVNVDGVPPMTSVVAQKLKMRADVVTDGGRPPMCCATRRCRRRLFCRSESGGVMALHSDPTQFTVAEARDALLAKRLSARELAQALYLAQSSQARRLNAFITETPDRALEQAAESDRRLQQGEARASGRHSARDQGSVLYREHPHDGGEPDFGAISFRPTNRRLRRNLWNAGAIIVGKTNLDEFAMGSSNETSCFGPVINPWRARGRNDDLVPGGSSGGSAAAVAARLASAAIGTDTGGSIRQPAAVTGIVGMKPTYGRCSRWGIVAFASSLDQAGPMTRSVRDAAIMLHAMASVDPMDSTSVDEPVPDYEAGLDGGVKGLRIGIPTGIPH